MAEKFPGPVCPCLTDPMTSPCSDFERMTEMCACAELGLHTEGAFVPG